jgi:hypothetical protein
MNIYYRAHLRRSQGTPDINPNPAGKPARVVNGIEVRVSMGTEPSYCHPSFALKITGSVEIPDHTSEKGAMLNRFSTDIVKGGASAAGGEPEVFEDF